MIKITKRQQLVELLDAGTSANNKELAEMFEITEKSIRKYKRDYLRDAKNNKEIVFKGIKSGRTKRQIQILTGIKMKYIHDCFSLYKKLA